MDLCLKEHRKIRSNEENDTKWNIFLICCGPVSASVQRVLVKRLRTNGSNLKSHLRKIGYILRAETIQSTCVQSSSINYHSVIQNGKWKLATKKQTNKQLSHTEDWTLMF